ncbi:hypothetical protein BOTBODRAFT_29290 [Botryobasidium botryosum FD-172 SS1]|uniref:Mitochondrial outer membrane transport complex Sam37/metaxin N-terminal domain-containing protein n=1 Tax=Botryobasidium botryosum (strain FD-172 SS1) TaxID=930990 RepID=A0A067MTD5_BOTB1|nr:hypothetical protein BOTBODRAFT_29290 [Botryobasidium botryosum FD-172 SS1]
MTEPSPTPGFALTIHVWPAKWDLPSLDPSCLAAVLYLQLAFPGNYAIAECTNPDFSPTGQLPYLTHGLHAVAPLPSIISYLSSLDPNAVAEWKREAPPANPTLDANNLTPLEAQQSVAWRSYIDSHLGDLVAHSFYALYPNYYELTRPTLAEVLPFPHKYYIPGRLREVYRPRLEAAGLWDVDEQMEEFKLERDATKISAESPSDTIKKTFATEKIVERARGVFDLISSILSDKPFFYQNQPTKLDITLASYTLLILNAPLPNPLLKNLLDESYPTLVAHARLVQSRAISPETPLAPKLEVERIHPLSLISQGISRMAGSGWGWRKEKKKSDADRRFDMWRWAWFAAAGIGMVGYVLGSGLIRISVVKGNGEGAQQVDDRGHEGDQHDGEDDEEEEEEHSDN